MSAGPLILVIAEEALASFLEKSGYRVSRLQDPARLTERSGEKASVVVLDRSLPGFEALGARGVARRTTLAGVPVIALGGSLADAAGFDGYCPLPCPPEELLDEILRVLLQKKSAPRPEGPPRRLQGARLLVVDDDEDTLEVLRQMLGYEGAEVTTARRASDGLALLRRQTFDLLICDIRLPDGTGDELVGELRSWPEGRGGRIPALALTAFATNDGHRTALTAGFNGYLSKPFAGDVASAVLALLPPGHPE